MLMHTQAAMRPLASNGCSRGSGVNGGVIAGFLAVLRRLTALMSAQAATHTHRAAHSSPLPSSLAPQTLLSGLCLPLASAFVCVAGSSTQAGDTGLRVARVLRC